MATFTAGDYITYKGKAAYPSIQTLRIDYIKGKGAETTTAIAGGCSVDNLANYRAATSEEIARFKEMEKRAYNKI